MKQALADVKVLDLGQGVPGPYCASLLADYGAEVVKVEPPEGDPSRRMGPFPDDTPDPEKSGLFLHLNRNKKGITLNLHSAAGRKMLLELVRRADILVENFNPSYLPSLGLEYETLERANPRLVLTSITPFGQTGPYKDHKATEMGVFALSEAMYLHGQPEREPLSLPPDVIWFQAGITAAIATLGALFVSCEQGMGQQVDVSALEAIVGNIDARPLTYEYCGVKGGRGTWPAGYPQGAFPCQDGYVVFGAGQDRYFRRLCHAIGRPDLLEDPRWATLEARAAHQEEFEGILIGWMIERTREEVFQTCQANGVMCAPIFTPEELLSNTHLRTRNYFVELEHPRAGRLTYTGAPSKLSATPWQARSPAPLLGEHNLEVYSSLLSQSQEDLARLRDMGVI